MPGVSMDQLGRQYQAHGQPDKGSMQILIV